MYKLSDGRMQEVERVPAAEELSLLLDSLNSSLKYVPLLTLIPEVRSFAFFLLFLKVARKLLFTIIAFR